MLTVNIRQIKGYKSAFSLGTKPILILQGQGYCSDILLQLQSNCTVFSLLQKLRNLG